MTSSSTSSDAQGYSDARGIQPARQAVAQFFDRRGVSGVTADDVFLGNGVSELIVMALQALLDTGDEVLVPSPDYPLWTGAINLCGGHAVHYRCDERNDWNPDLEHVASRITDRTKALVIINPNNPTGAVYSRETMLGLLDLARKHGLLVLTDEIYDQIIYDGAVHHSAAALAPDLLVLTLGGLSKTYRLAGFRSGWLVVSGPARARRRLPRRARAAGQHAPVPERSGSARNRARARRPGRHHSPARARRAAARPARSRLGADDRHPRRHLLQAGRRAVPVPASRPEPSTRSATTSR